MGKSRNRQRAKPRTRADTPGSSSGVFMLSDRDFWESCNTDYVRFDRHPDVKTCVKKIADLISSMTIFFMHNTDLGDVRVKNGFSRVLDIQPNRYMTRKTLLHKVVEEMLLTGNSVLLPSYSGIGSKNVDSGELLTELKPIQTGNIRFMPLDDGGYRAEINKMLFDDDEIIHFVYNPAIEQPWRGEGLKVYLKETLDNLTDSQKIKGDFYTKHYKPNIVFSFTADTAQFDSEESRSDLYDTWLRVKPGDPYMVPSQIIDFKSFPAMSLKDIAVNESAELDKKAIAKMFGIPLFMIGLGAFNKIEYNNFIDTVIMPIVKGMEQELTRKLVLSPDYYIKFNLESLKAFDLEQRISMMFSGKKLGVYSANEIRILTGYEPINKPDMNEYSILENFIPTDKIGDQKKLNNDGDIQENNNSNNLRLRASGSGQKIFAIDFDGTLVENKYPLIGEIKSDVFDFVKAQKEHGFKLILWTCRGGELLDAAVQFCRDNGLEFDSINDNTAESVDLYKSNSRKVHADYYLDDKNIGLADISAIGGDNVDSGNKGSVF